MTWDQGRQRDLAIYVDLPGVIEPKDVYFVISGSGPDLTVMDLEKNYRFQGQPREGHGARQFVQD